MTRPPRHPIAIELASALLVPAGAFGFIRMFADASAVIPIIGAAMLSTALAVALRRARMPLIVAALVSVASLAVLISARYAPGTSKFGFIPTGETLDILKALGRDGTEQFRELKAPVEASAPFVGASMAGAWLMAFLTDWGALRLRLAFEPVLPAGLMFIFAAVLGSGERQGTSTLVFAAAVGIWAITQRVTNLASSSVWLPEDRSRGLSRLALAGISTVAIALVAGYLVGPRLPGTDAEELYTWRDAGDPTRRVISPFVSIESRLVEEQNVELFTVAADSPAYWRLAGLDNYENRIWTTAGAFRPESGDLPGEQPRAGTTSVLDQTYTIKALDAIWLPAAFAPSELVSSEVEATWHSGLSTLTVSTDSATSDGVTYQVESVVANYSAAELNAAPAAIPADIADRYLPTNADVSPVVASEAQAIVAAAGATTRYEQMMALQAYFRAFDYSLELGPRGDDPIATFLAERVGFCQQFSGTFALMARALGAPARVAVGFTWGDPVEGEANTYSVTGRHAHAWPEVWFEGLGWVAFEPTPGRGSPAAAYTGVEAEQDSLTQPAAPSASTSTTEPSNAEAAPATDLTVPDDFFPDAGSPSQVDTDGGGFDVPWFVLAIGAAIFGYCIAVPSLIARRRQRRRDNASDNKARVEAAWADAAEDLAIGFSLQRRPAETRTEFADRVRDDQRLPEGALDTLARATTNARFSANDLDPAITGEADAASKQISDRVQERTPRSRRWLSQLDPRRLPSTSTLTTDELTN